MDKPAHRARRKPTDPRPQNLPTPTKKMASTTTLKIPYSILATSASTGILFAVCAGQIVSFPANGGKAISVWIHPDQLPVAAEGAGAKRSAAELEEGWQEGVVKRQRIEEAETEAAVVEKAKEGKAEAEVKKASAQEKKKKESVVKNEQALITLLMVSEDGKYIIAVSAHDKTLWVFEHDGAGHLAQSSRRVMPKRPCGITLTSTQTIISADKFGDVYALPLLPSLPTTDAPTTDIPTGPALTLAVKHYRSHPSATSLTVHSAGNLRALEAQKRHLTERQKELANTTKAPEAPAFKHTLVLGHVSMLTDVVVGRDYKGREYIVTADRDEHIRVSRAPPQAYVIEGFCLGHREFVSALAVGGPEGKWLVSGGGDGELFVWDWLNSTLLHTVDILSAAKSFGAEKIAVSRIISAGNAFFLILENVPAVFQVSPVNSVLSNVTATKLPGAPLGITLVNSRPVVSVDGHGILALFGNGTFDYSEVSGLVPEVTEEEKKKMLYTVESMRKKVMDFLAEKEEKGAQETEEVEALAQE